MDPKVRKAIYRAVEKEPFAQALNMDPVELELGYSLVEMIYGPTAMNNIYDQAHGGAFWVSLTKPFSLPRIFHEQSSNELKFHSAYRVQGTWDGDEQ